MQYLKISTLHCSRVAGENCYQTSQDHPTVTGFWEVHSSALVGRPCDDQRPKTAIIWDAGIMSSRPATIETPGAIATTASSGIIGPKERLCRRPISQPRVKRSCRCLVVQPLQQDRGRHKHPFIGGHCRLQLVELVGTRYAGERIFWEAPGRHSRPCEGQSRPRSSNTTRMTRMVPMTPIPPWP